MLRIAVQTGQIAEAKAAADAENEGIEIRDRDADWITARGGSSNADSLGVGLDNDFLPAGWIY